MDTHKSVDTEIKRTKKTLPDAARKHCFGQPGVTNNGRPKGSRTRFAEAFVNDFMRDWEQHGTKVLKDTREKDPSAYLRVAASIIPKQMELKGDKAQIDRILENYDDAQLKQLIAGLCAIGSETGNNLSRPTPADKVAVTAEPDCVH